MTQEQFEALVDLINVAVRRADHGERSVHEQTYQRALEHAQEVLVTGDER